MNLELQYSVGFASFIGKSENLEQQRNAVFVECCLNLNVDTKL